MPRFGVEPWAASWREVVALGPRHYAEVSQFREGSELMRSRAPIPYDLDLERLRQLDSIGKLSLVVGRERGLVIGYHVAFIDRMLHYDLLAAKGDVYYLLPEWRRGRIVLDFWSTVHASLSARGVQIVYDITKLGEGLDHSKLFLRLGYLPVERAFAKWLW